MIAIQSMGETVTREILAFELMTTHHSQKHANFVTSLCFSPAFPPFTSSKWGIQFSFPEHSIHFFSRKSDSDYNAEDATIIFDKNQFVMLCSCNLFILEPDISQVANVYLTGCGRYVFLQSSHYSTQTANITWRMLCMWFQNFFLKFRLLDSRTANED